VAKKAIWSALAIPMDRETPLLDEIGSRRRDAAILTLPGTPRPHDTGH